MFRFAAHTYLSAWQTVRRVFGAVNLIKRIANSSGVGMLLLAMTMLTIDGLYKAESIHRRWPVQRG
jgi:hypothetical protein